MKNISILGVKITSATMEELHEGLEHMIRAKGQGFVLSGNVHGIQQACRQPWLKDFYGRADLVRVDGAGIVLGARILGSHVCPRLTWADWGWPLARHLAETGRSVFLLGGPKGAAAKAALKLVEHTPTLKVVGSHHGHFQKTGPENQRVCDLINETAPDVLIVGMGMPLQERWILDNKDGLNAKVFLTAGAAFEYLAGEVSRCPQWMGNAGLEWLYRLVQNPRRLAGRYLWGNTWFLTSVLLERFQKGKVEDPGSCRP